MSAQHETAIEAALATIGDLSPRTLRDYRGGLRAWWRWCVDNERRPWPARPEDVVAYATELLDAGTSLAGVRWRIVTVLGGAHRRAGLPAPFAGGAVEALLWPNRNRRPGGRLASWHEAAIDTALDAALATFGDLRPGTIESYRSTLRGWWHWCDRHDRRPWPAGADDVAAYARGLLGEGASLRLARQRISTVLGGVHRLAGLPDPSTAEDVQALLWPDGGRRGVISAGLASRRRGRLPASDEAALDSVLAFFGDLSRSTLENYRTCLRAWWRWCADNHRRPWPAWPGDVAVYSTALLAEGVRLGYARHRIASVLGVAHRRAGLPDPTATEAVRSLLWPARDGCVAAAADVAAWAWQKGHLPAADEAALDSALAFFGDLSRSMLEHYRTCLRAWWRWCTREGRQPWPVRADVAAAYATEILGREGGARASDSRVIPMLALAHRRAGLPDLCGAVKSRGGNVRMSTILRHERPLAAADHEAIAVVLALFPDARASSQASRASGLRTWWRWCAREGRQPWPARADDVAAYAAELLEQGARPHNIQVRLRMVLGRAHRRAGLPDPCAAGTVRAALPPQVTQPLRRRLSGDPDGNAAVRVWRDRRARERMALRACARAHSRPLPGTGVAPPVSLPLGPPGRLHATARTVAAGRQRAALRAPFMH